MNEQKLQPVPAEAETTARTLQIINQEYTNYAALLGDSEFKLRQLVKKCDVYRKKMDDLSEEGRVLHEAGTPQPDGAA